MPYVFVKEHYLLKVIYIAPNTVLNKIFFKTLIHLKIKEFKEKFFAFLQQTHPILLHEANIV